jgi:hypothetical protein
MRCEVEGNFTRGRGEYMEIIERSTLKIGIFD